MGNAVPFETDLNKRLRKMLEDEGVRIDREHLERVCELFLRPKERNLLEVHLVDGKSFTEIARERAVHRQTLHIAAAAAIECVRTCVHLSEAALIERCLERPGRLRSRCRDVVLKAVLGDRDILSLLNKKQTRVAVTRRIRGLNLTKFAEEDGLQLSTVSRIEDSAFRTICDALRARGGIRPRHS